MIVMFTLVLTFLCRERRERLAALAAETIDLAKDPYFMRFADLSSVHFGDNLNLYRNHLGTYECKLCLTLHNNEASYLAHTQACDGDDDHNNYEDDNISSTLIFRARSTRATWLGEPPRKLLMLLSSLHHRNRWRWNWNILLK